MERPDSEYQMQNGYNKGLKWNYNHKSKCGAAVGLALEVARQAAKRDKKATKNALLVYVKDNASSRLLINRAHGQQRENATPPSTRSRRPQTP